MTINNISLHHLDVKTNTVTPITIDETSENLNKYVDSLIEDIHTNPNKRLYEFKKGNTQVKSTLVPIIKNEENVDELIIENSKRLLEKEKKSQERIARLNIEIQKGSLLHLSFFSEGTHKVIICKVEHDEVLSEINFDLIRGLNTKKKVFKAIMIYLDENFNITYNYVHDKNSSRYWWDDFLELEQLNTDDENTEKSLNELDKALTKYKNKFYTDYLLIRNTLIGFYRSNDVLNYSDVITNVFENYTPLNSDFPKEKLITRIKELPESKGFDTQFKISKKKITKKIKTKLRLRSNLFLSLDDHVDNLKNVLKPIEEGGNKYVRILSSEGYDKLKDLGFKE
ncbi:hypothetical protein [Pseudofulvibacter geojedonensis]|uniref:Nucleoid-associated protein NdpA n=1 Tax=Pseudofulvibacter geojedonensis TaxID=1123758 RepID=A0ABW3I338_9FLAO